MPVVLPVQSPMTFTRVTVALTVAPLSMLTQPRLKPVTALLYTAAVTPPRSSMPSRTVLGGLVTGPPMTVTLAMTASVWLFSSAPPLLASMPRGSLLPVGAALVGFFLTMAYWMLPL